MDRRSPSRLLRLTGAAALVLALSACQAPRPDVTFYGNRTAVESGYTLWCSPNQDRTQFECDQPHGPDGEARLSLRPGQSVQINVPDAIAEQPWLATFVYRTADGEQLQGRSEVLDDHDLSYTLTPIESGDQLLRVEVVTGFEVGPQTTADPNSTGFDIGATRSWVLTVDPSA
ncbi:DUF2771 family protein [Nakamurella flavida]|uniref:DUF2771 family protein n=1 Tax=Nakamurella flavida TaxID=363630 RepID=A0A938YI98_9ACTN|nr:DUF2771 family protein [Nakamurella flavida]MBM9475614.1 DUF2771 family protein [Nakamurella flavida]MDP9778110.1 hypothetical protein [Nakamurella flavida]